MKLRDYQRDALEATLSLWKGGTRSVLDVMATGTGKTVLFAGVIRRKFPKRAMVIAHRQELIWQARDKIQRVTGLHVDVEMGEFKAGTERGLFHPKARVIVSTIQTQVAGGDGAGRLGKFDPRDFGLLIIDEAHHAVSPSYRRMIDYYMTNPDLVVLGVTATPDRSDESALGTVFDEVGYKYEILQAIKDGWLVPIDQQMISIESLDFSGVRTTAGDLNGADLAAVMESEKNLHGIASATIEIAADKRGIGFASSVNHARILAEIFNRHRPGMAASVSAKTDKDERAKIISDFAAGKIQWLWNCGVFTEGFDDSGVEVISMARPTKSRALYAQMAGRATRPRETIAHKLGEATHAGMRRHLIQTSGKPSCLIVDFVGNSGKHKLMCSADILGGNYSAEAVEKATEFAKASGQRVRIGKQIETEEEQLEKARQRRIEEEARRARLVAKSSFKSQRIDPFNLLQIKPVSASRSEDKKVLTEKQRAMLRRGGYDPDKMEYAAAKQLVGILVDRLVNKKCSLKQVELLKKFAVDGRDFTFEQASAVIDQIAKNGWRKPDGLTVPKAVEKSSDMPEPSRAPVASAPVGDDDDIPF